MNDRVRLELDGAVAIITNDNPDKHNAFDDEMDLRLFEILGELAAGPEVRAVVWRGEGKSFSSGRDVGAIGGGQVELSHHELMRRGHRGIQQIWDLDAPMIVACKGWSSAASFQRALLCDIRIAAEGARFMLPEVTYGVIPDTGGVGACSRSAATASPATWCSPAGVLDGRRGATPTASSAGSCRADELDAARGRWPSRSPPRRR